MLFEHNFSISKRGLSFFNAISFFQICFADYSHVQTVSRTEEVHIIIKFVPSTPDIVCVVFSKLYIVVIFYRRPVH